MLHVKLFNSLGYSVVGLDLLHSYAREGVKRGLKIIVGKTQALPFPKEIFDITASRDLLCKDCLRPSDITQSLFEQHRVLKNGGIAIVYSMLGDRKYRGGLLSMGMGLVRRLELKDYEGLPFVSVRRYSLDFQRQIRYVDVLEK